MKRSIALFILFFALSGCNNLKIDPAHSTMTEAEYLSHHNSPLSHSSENIYFEPNDVISTDDLLEKQINGRVRQTYPNLLTDVIVDGNRIIISSIDSQNETMNQGIRKAVGKLSHGRKLIIVTDDVFQTYRKSQIKIGLKE